MEERSEERPVKEPVRKVWIWVIMAFIVLAAIPWYLPSGTVGPIILGVPYWVVISVFFSLALCAYLSWLCIYEWDVVEAEEEREKSARVSETERG